MSYEEIKDLEGIVLSHHNTKDVELKEDMNLIEDLGYDSVSVMGVIGAIEERFDIEFEFEDLNEDFLVYGNLLKIVNSKLSDNK